MNNIELSVVFFGTGPVAEKSLQNLAKNFMIELVITKPKPAHHRGNWPVAELAEKLGIPIDYAKTSFEVEETLGKRKLISKVGIVIDFGLIISSKTINQFPFGIINSHFSLLPRYRGADPITFAILNGDQTTGVSLMKIVPKMDEGPLIAQKAINLSPDVNSVQLTDKLVDLSNSMIVDDLPKYLRSELKLQNQSANGITYSHKIKKQDGIIDWSKSAELIEWQIRAYYEWPRSRTKFNSIDLIISEAKVVNQAGKAGELKLKDNELIVFCGKKSLKIIKLQPPGKKEMAISEFLRGYGVRLGLG